MRWPNDVLVGEEKLAGLLIDQFCPGRAVVGIGINVRNQPQSQDGSLRGRVTRLADLLPVAPTLHDLALLILSELRTTWLAVQRRGPEEILSRVNELWDLARPVQLDLDGVLRTGEFAGVDAAGRLQLRLPDARIQIFEPHQVRHLRELTSNA
jgi:biotin-(acetyl-CoA carboxylase) ligase